MVFSFRTIFLLIRGIDQTGRAFDGVSKGLATVEERQKALAQSGYRLLFAGAAFMAFGAMATGAILKTLEASTRGSRILDSFGLAIDRLKRNFAESIIDNFGPALESALDTLEQLANNEQFIDIAVKVAIAIGPGAVVLGAAMTATGISFMLVSKLVGLFSAAGLISAGTAGGITTLAALAGAAVIIIGLAAVIEISLKNIIWSMTPQVAKDAMANIDAFIREKTGLKGSLFSPEQNLAALGIGSSTSSSSGGVVSGGWSPMGPPSPTTVIVNNNIGTLQTKMEEEEWTDWFAKTWNYYMGNSNGTDGGNP